MSKIASNYEIMNPTHNVNEFITSHADYVYVNDANNNVYSQSAPIIFNSTSLVGKDSTKHLQISEGFIVIPMTHTVQIARSDGGGANIPSFVTKSQNVNLMSLKNHYSLVDRVQLAIGSVSDITNSGSYYTNLYMNEKAKKKHQADMYLDAQISPSYFDDENSYSFDNTTSVGEVNNNINSGSSMFQQNFVNGAILNRNMNRFVLSDPAGNLSYVGNIKSMEQALDSVNAWNYTFTPYFTQTATTLTYYDVAIIRLADLNDFFKKQNTPMAQLSNLSLKLYINNGTAVVTYADGGANSTADQGATVGNYVQYKPISVSWNPSSMKTCPYLVSSIANSSYFGEPCLTQGATGAGAGIKLTINSSVGWAGQNFPCRLVIPEVTLSPQIVSKLKSDPARTILYNDFLVDDTTVGISGSGQFSKQLQTFTQRMKKLYIIPFLSNQNSTVSGAGTMLPPQQSCVSTAGVTCSHLRISDVQIRVGTENVFLQELNKYSWQMYEQNAYKLLNAETGNSVNSIFKSGLITKSMFNKCYNVYEYDVDMSKFESEFDAAKQPFLTWTCYGNPALKYDFVILIEYQKEITIDTSTGATLAN